MPTGKYLILIVDDEDDILEFVGYNLRQEGYRVISATNGADALRIAREQLPHLILLDVMMPDSDGVEVCREMRQISALNGTIIAFLTARSETYSQIAGYEAGADDYIVKPIKPRVLTSKVASLLRRYSLTPSQSASFMVGDLLIDSERYCLRFKGQEITLPRKEFEILSLLASKPNKVFTREEIYFSIWSGDINSGDRTIDVHIRKIREKLNIENIRTVKGVGYKYEYKEDKTIAES
jgi:two-component system, OmpR family, alkaline phosphatase synthesis response regulator PhoP